LHPPTASWSATTPRAPVADDIEAVTAVRSAVGDGMALMLDSTWGYSYAEALRVGRVLEELDYEWYEDPLPAEDIYGYSKLKQHLRIPILATEVTLGGLYALPAWIAAGATDALRGDVVIKGGITGMMKIAHLAEAYRMNCEVHFAYNALNNVASLHVIMAIPNCDWFEVLAFNPAGRYGLEHLSYGLARPIEIDGDGYVHAPGEPGLGYGVDWELIESARIGEIQ
jgi:L-alanine-DL-glutamate epimerase-like enolase superfamily enzyme